MECIELQIGAYLHDIGTLGLDNNLVYKTGAYDAAELEQIKHHPEIGVKLLSPIGLPQYIISIVRHHHERYDGTGYPDGLKGESIPLLTRIVTLADSFDAMVTDRSYRKALQWEEVIRRIKEGAGVQFDPHLVQILLKMMDEKGKQFLVEPSGKA
jgi:HD-GYP domain-containing protein (c-di-GMP phosphodiesterase class II)